MKEILFHAKRKDNGEWVQGDLIHRQIWASSLCIIRESDDGFDHYEEYEVDHETVSEFTGLRDKNGKQIFEGDIIKETSGNNIRLLGDKREIRSGIGVIEFGEYRTPSDDPFEWADAYGFYIFGGNVLYPTISMYPYKYEQYGEKEVVIELEVIGNKWDNPELLEKCHT